MSIFKAILRLSAQTGETQEKKPGNGKTGAPHRNQQRLSVLRPCRANNVSTSLLVSPAVRKIQER